MNSLLRQLGEALLISPSFDPKEQSVVHDYDPEMLYVECRLCGKPVMWEAGRTTSLLVRTGINPHLIDERCLILSDGCKQCQPYEEAFPLSIVRLSAVTPQDLLLLHKTGGNA
ncbi:hypothetical protein LJC48_02065 [Desulfovibrio sp. OttesenSCG-928-C06]|nr:hypothetical protein [Desulfovibrio sp. OttesenSCG-928-C06]